MVAYLLLCDRGLKGSESSAEIKKAYHKSALRHHPDKVFFLIFISARHSSI